MYSVFADRKAFHGRSNVRPQRTTSFFRATATDSLALSDWRYARPAQRESDGGRCRARFLLAHGNLGNFQTG